MSSQHPQQNQHPGVRPRPNIIYAQVDETLKRRLKRWAFDHEMPMNEVVESALEHYLAVVDNETSQEEPRA